MLTYEQWDFIADSYIPLLVLVSVVSLTLKCRTIGFSKTLNSFALIAVSVVYVYSMMVVDGYFKIFPSFGLDYSAHTALALVFVIYLALKSINFLMFALASMLLYASLMVYQEYHSVADIAATALVIIPVVLLIQKKVADRLKFS